MRAGRDAVRLAHEVRRTASPDAVDLLGVPTCSITPLFITTTRSATSSASSWSCVTKTDVRPICRAGAQPAAQVLAHLGVQRAEGLVQQQQPGSIASARASATLALAAGKLRRIAIAQPIELDQPQQFLARAAMAAREDGHAACARRPKATLSNTVMWRNSA
jgi:hypothetical protein